MRDGVKDSNIDYSLSGSRLLKGVEILQVNKRSIQVGHDKRLLVHGVLPELFDAAPFEFVL